MNGVEYAKKQLAQAFSLVNQCTDGMTDEQFNFKPGGTANPPAKTLVHLAASMEFFVVHMIKGEQMSWPALAEQHGLPANSMQIWGYDGPIPQAPVKEFVQKTQQVVLDYVATLNDADLDREIETQFFGKQTIAFLLQLGAMHAVGHAGDIAAVKGMQGLKGLPF
ncbi:MAG TPA: DinB family protein [Dehalococcoidia bacterium]